ncbi:MAG TPA: hypothetical protein VIG64_06185 [Actinomycetota bacterium]
MATKAVSGVSVLAAGLPEGTGASSWRKARYIPVRDGAGSPRARDRAGGVLAGLADQSA